MPSLAAVLASLGAAVATVSAENTIELDGSHGYISINGLSRRFRQAQFTMAMWVYPTPGLSSGLGSIFSFNTATGDNVMSLALDRGANTYEFKDTGAHGGTHGARSGSRVPQHQWHWIAMTLTAGTNIHVYMGGADSDSSAVEVLTVTDALLPLAKVQSGERFAIGTEWDGDTGSDWLCGFVDEFRTWDSPLSLAELNFVMRGPIKEPLGAANIHLVGYFPFSEGTGETTIDQSASKLVGTIHAGSWVTTYTPYDKLSEIKDKIDRAIRLDGAHGYVNGDRATAEFEGRTEISAVAWARPGTDGLHHEGCVIAFNAKMGGNQNMICYDTKMKMFYYKDDKKSVYMGAKNCGTSLPNEWHQVAFTIDANDNGVLYIDAEPKATFKTTVRPQRDSHFSMGQEWDGDSFTNLRPSNHFKGEIDEVALFTRVLTQDELRQMKSQTHYETKMLGMVAYWTFDEGRGRLTADRSGNEGKGRHTATLRPGSWWTVGHSVSPLSFTTILKYVAMTVIGCLAVFTVCGKREALLDCVADFVGKIAPSSQGYKTVPTTDDYDETGGLLDDDEKL